MSGQVLLQVSELKVAYGGIQAVKGVDFEVRAGELVCLIGSNGAGKTSTMNAIPGSRPCSGDRRVLSSIFHRPSALIGSRLPKAQGRSCQSPRVQRRSRDIDTS